MGIYDQQLTINTIDEFGESITLRTVTKTLSDWGDPTETTSDTTGIKAVFNILTQDDIFYKEGIFRNGDILFFFKPDQSNVSRGNRIQYNSAWYEIDEVVEHKAGGTTYALVARVKKI
jgi:hypothetical protein